MKTFKQFLEEAANTITRIRDSGFKLKKGGYKDPSLPDGMMRWGWTIKKAGRDVTPKEMNDYQKRLYDKYKQVTSPVKPA